MWHAAKESLPTKQNLFNRNVLKETQCSHYEEHLIDCLHALWLCDQVQLVWWLETSFLNLFQKKFRSFVDLVSTDCTVFDKDAIGSEKKTNMGFIEVASKAKELLIEFLDVQWKLIRDVQPKCQVKWNPPSEGM